MMRGGTAGQWNELRRLPLFTYPHDLDMHMSGSGCMPGILFSFVLWPESTGNANPPVPLVRAACSHRHCTRFGNASFKGQGSGHPQGPLEP